MRGRTESSNSWLSQRENSVNVWCDFNVIVVESFLDIVLTLFSVRSLALGRSLPDLDQEA